MNNILGELDKTETKEIVALLASTLEGMCAGLQNSLDFEQRMNFEKLVKSLRKNSNQISQAC